MHRHEIFIDNKKELYTNGDTISGRIVLVPPKDLVARAIDIKLCCREVAIVEYTSNNGTTTTMHRDIKKRKIVTMRERVIGDDSKTQKHILPRGPREFPFSFQIPMAPEAQLSSFNGHLGGGVKWYIKLVISRSRLRPNIREVEPFILRRYQSIANLIPNVGRDLSSEKSYRAHLPGYNGFNLLERVRGDQRQQLDLQLSARIPSPFLFLDEINLIEVTLSCSHPNLITVLWLEIKIKEEVNIHANSHYHHLSRYHHIHKGPFNQSPLKSGLDKVNECIVQAKLPDSLVANFSTDLHRVTDNLIIKVKLSSSHAHRHRTELKIRTGIDIWGGIRNNGHQPSLYEKIPTTSKKN